MVLPRVLRLEWNKPEIANPQLTTQMPWHGEARIETLYCLFILKPVSIQTRVDQNLARSSNRFSFLPIRMVFVRCQICKRWLIIILSRHWQRRRFLKEHMGVIRENGWIVCKVSADYVIAKFVPKVTYEAGPSCSKLQFFPTFSNSLALRWQPTLLEIWNKGQGLILTLQSQW